MTRYEAYRKARTEYLKKKEREADCYQCDAIMGNRKAALWNRRQSTRAD